RSVDPAEMQIQNVMPGFGPEDLPVVPAEDRLATQRFDLAGGAPPPERDHLDRQRKGCAECRNLFGVVRDDNQATRGGRDDLLLEQRPASAFDQVQTRIDLV